MKVSKISRILVIIFLLSDISKLGKVVQLYIASSHIIDKPTINFSISFDIKVFFQTIIKVFKHDGIVEGKVEEPVKDKEFSTVEK